MEVVKMGVPVGLNELPLEKTAALVLVDRSMDVLSPLHHKDGLLDKLLNVISQLPDRSDAPRTSRLMEWRGCGKTPLFAAEPSELPTLMHRLLGKSTREGSLMVRHSLHEALSSTGKSPSPRGPPTKKEFSTGVTWLSKDGRLKSAQAKAVAVVAEQVAEAVDPEKAVNIRSELIHSGQQQIANMQSTDDIVQYFLDLLLNASKAGVPLSTK